jgi:hypothetical protein
MRELQRKRSQLKEVSRKMRNKEKEKKKHDIIMKIYAIANKLRLEAGKLEPIQINHLGKELEQLVGEYREIDDYEEWLRNRK